MPRLIKRSGRPEADCDAAGGHRDRVGGGERRELVTRRDGRDEIAGIGRRPRPPSQSGALRAGASAKLAPIAARQQATKRARTRASMAGS
jgi:hypothetical protein